MPKIITRSLVVLVLLAMFPPLLVARARSVNSELPRVHIIQDMDNQPRYRAQDPSELFADQRAMRPFPDGTVPRGQRSLDEHLQFGLGEDGWATTFPDEVPLNRATLQRGRERFNIYCSPCHGESGDGRGMVALRAQELMEVGKATWVMPTAFHDPTVLEKPVGNLFNTITNGIRTMPAYGPQIPVKDRWAIVAWVKALQRSQVATWDDLPPEQRNRLEAQRREAMNQAESAQEGGANTEGNGS